MKNKEIIEEVFNTYSKPNFRMQFDMASDMLIALLNKALKLKEKDILKLIKKLDPHKQNSTIQILKKGIKENGRK